MDKIIQLVQTPLVWLLCAASGILAFIIGMLINKHISNKETSGAQKMAEKIIEEAEKEARARKREADLEAKDIIFAAKNDFDQQTREHRKEMQKAEQKLAKREEYIDNKVEILDKKEKELVSQGRNFKNLKQVFPRRIKNLRRLLKPRKNGWNKFPVYQ